ncbi:MAG: O-antigen ligase family protein, partial [Oscillospiraceae bacterium]|nr:O-antigen ligase family protein [Oscillospiraceae bacterium]
LLYALAFISIVLLRLQYYFSYIIEDVLHKNITFTGRTDIWDISINLIKRSPIIGYGVYEGHGFVFYRGQYYYSHNAILEILIQGGAIALIFFIAMLVVSCISLYRYKNNHISGIITFTVFTLLSMMIMEAYLSYIWTFGILTVSCCVGDIIRQTEELPSQNKASTNSTRLRYIRYRMSR